MTTSTKTFSVCPEARQPTIKVNTDGAIETFTFRRKAQADKKIMELNRAGYTFDATRETTEEDPTPIASLVTCPRCGHPAQREEAPNGETYISCGHCAGIVFDRTGEGESEMTLDEVVKPAIATSHIPLPNEGRYMHPAPDAVASSEFNAQAQPPDPYERAPEFDKYTDAYAWRDRMSGQIVYHFIGCNPNTMLASTPPPAPTHVNWSSRHAPMSPVEALRLAVTHGVFAEDTTALLLASLEAADQKAIDDAEQLAHARDSVAVNLEMHRVEAAVLDLPF